MKLTPSKTPKIEKTKDRKNFTIGLRKHLVPSVSSRNKTLLNSDKNYAKADIKLNFFTLFERMKFKNSEI